MPDAVNERIGLSAPGRTGVTAPPKAGRKQRLRLLLSLGGIAIVLVGAAYMWLTGGRYVSVDDSYLHAAKLMVSTDVSGLVSEVDVKEGQTVKAGDILFRVDPRQFQIAVDNARANLEQTRLTLEGMKADYQRMLADVSAAQAQTGLDKTNFDRNAYLVNTSAGTRQAYDQAKFTLDADVAKYQSALHTAQVQLVKLGGSADAEVTTLPAYLAAKAQLDEAQRQLDHSVVRAPFAGVVTAVDSLQVGTYLVSQTATLTNQGAVALVSNQDIWVDANVKETDLTYMNNGDAADVTVDAYPGRVWHGHVQRISPASGSEFAILPAQNATGNWTKVVQRLAVRVVIDREAADPALRAGMSAVVTIDTKHRRALSDLL
jgi:membrane fusion protein (multidrug efflux system)